MDQLSHESFQFEESSASRAREGGRDSLLLGARMRLGAASEARQVRVRNLSRGGLMAEFPGQVKTNDPVDIEVRGIGWVKGHVAWVAEGRVGVAFDEAVDPIHARKPVGGAARR